MSNTWWDAWYNVTAGCTPVSPACDNCYAINRTWRFMWTESMRKKYNNLVMKSVDDSGSWLEWTGRVATFPDRLTIPLKRRTPTKYFVCGLSDLFHEQVPWEFIDRVYDVMIRCPQHTFMVLTKRPKLAAAWAVHASYHGYDHIMHGTTIENADALPRMGHLLSIPGKHFVSMEPLLGPVDISPYLIGSSGGGMTHWHNINLVIVGGENGRNARKMNPEWAESIRMQCESAGVKYFFKGPGGEARERQKRQVTGQKRF